MLGILLDNPYTIPSLCGGISITDLSPQSVPHSLFYYVRHTLAWTLFIIEKIFVTQCTYVHIFKKAYFCLFTPAESLIPI